MLCKIVTSLLLNYTKAYSKILLVDFFSNDSADIVYNIFTSLWKTFDKQKVLCTFKGLGKSETR